jgi:DNA-binding MarR family transcriptional regulator/N-acetylglutamate synthase-like GNAT family acetyltransferase
MPRVAAPAVPADRIHAVRRFNRFYTRRIGVLDEGLLDSPFSLTEVRVLYELAHRDEPSAAVIVRELGLDPGYVSRIVRRFRRDGLLTTRPCDADARRSLLQLTAKGRRTVARLEERSNRQVAAVLARVAAADQRRLLHAMHTVERLLGARADAQAPFVLRPPEPGDLGWIVHRHGALYASEYGYNEEFEALVASIVAEFGRQHDPARERCWIAEREGEIVGSVFLVRASDEVAKLRLLLVEPSARGLGIGARLVAECVRFARARGYRTLALWTQSELLPARRIYERAGFSLVREERHHSFGKDLVAETWELAL